MSAEIPILALYLDGPMQAWGYQSRFNRRTTLSYPTKSGILGILCAALGVPKSDRKTLSELARLRMEILALSENGHWIDYHTVGGGYRIPEALTHIPRVADGSRAKDAAITYREYLSDARFGVLISGDREWLVGCEAALKNPKWGIWLGRKTCIPASPISQGIFPSRRCAVEHLQRISGGRIWRRVIEVERFEDGTDTLLDVPVDFSLRGFTARRVCVEDMPE